MSENTTRMVMVTSDSNYALLFTEKSCETLCDILLSADSYFDDKCSIDCVAPDIYIGRVPNPAHKSLTITVVDIPFGGELPRKYVISACDNPPTRAQHDIAFMMDAIKKRIAVHNRFHTTMASISELLESIAPKDRISLLENLLGKERMKCPQK